MFRKLSILAIAAISALAFAIPAVASAHEWLEEEAPLEGTASATVSGSLELAVLGGLASVKCPTSGTIEGSNEAGSSVPSFSISTPCTVGGLLAGCTVSSVTTENLPWAVEIINGPALKVSGIKFTNHFKSGCLAGTTVSAEGALTATPDKAAAMSSVTFSGELSTSLGTNANVKGTLAVSPAGVYGIN